MKKLKKSGRPRKHAKEVRRRRIVAARNQQDYTSCTSQTDRVRITAAKFAVSSCGVSSNIFNIGIGYALLSRRLSPDRIAVSTFMVDVYCLGVKNAFYRELSHDQFYDLVHGLNTSSGLVDVEPEYACKLVSEAVDYAENFGFAPHEDYPVAAALFGDIDATLCTDEFVFGKDGKPFYIAGPRDTPAKIRTIMKKLTDNLGEENFEFILAA